MSNSNPIRRPLKWLQEVMTLDGPELPDAVNVGDPVRPVVDVGQNGWTVAVHKSEYTPDAVGPGVYVPIVNMDITTTRYVYVIAIKSTSVATQTARFVLQRGGTGAVYGVYNESIGPSGDLRLNETTSLLPLWIPPGYQLMFFTTLGGGDINARVVWSELPPGSTIG